MKKSVGIGVGVLIAAVAIVLIFAIVIISFGFSTYNGLIDKEEAVKSQKSIIATQLERREELIPNLVAVVKGYSEHEQSTFTAVTEARAAVNAASDPVEKAEASAQVDKALNIWVNAVTENYPTLKADQQFVSLQDQLEGTANRIAVARKDYIDAVNDYNKAVRRFPGNIIASIFGFQQVEYFEADESANSVPQVSFD